MNDSPGTQLWYAALNTVHNHGTDTSAKKLFMSKARDLQKIKGFNPKVDKPADIWQQAVSRKSELPSKGPVPEFLNKKAFITGFKTRLLSLMLYKEAYGSGDDEGQYDTDTGISHTNLFKARKAMTTFHDMHVAEGNKIKLLLDREEQHSLKHALKNLTDQKSIGHSIEYSPAFKKKLKAWDATDGKKNSPLDKIFLAAQAKLAHLNKEAKITLLGAEGMSPDQVTAFNNPTAPAPSFDASHALKTLGTGALLGLGSGFGLPGMIAGGLINAEPAEGMYRRQLGKYAPQTPDTTPAPTVPAPVQMPPAPKDMQRFSKTISYAPESSPIGWGEAPPAMPDKY